MKLVRHETQRAHKTSSGRVNGCFLQQFPGKMQSVRGQSTDLDVQTSGNLIKLHYDCVLLHDVFRSLPRVAPTSAAHSPLATTLNTS